MEKQGHQKALPPMGSSLMFLCVFSRQSASRCLDASRENKLFLRRMGRTRSPHGILETWWVVDSYWVLLFEPLTSTHCTSRAKGGGVRIAAAWPGTYHGHMDLVVFREGFKKALCSVSWHSTAQKEICILSPSACQDGGRGCLEGPCDHSTVESRH